MTNKEIIDWLLGFCVHGDCGCMLWRGALSRGRAGSTGQLPAVRHPVLGRTMPARRALLMAMGVDVRGLCCTSSCGDPMCMAPKHAIAITRQELQKRSGVKLTMNVVRNARLAEHARKQSSLSMEQVQEMRRSGLRAKQAAEAYGVKLQVAARILRGETWREYGANPFAGLGA